MSDRESQHASILCLKHANLRLEIRETNANNAAIGDWRLGMWNAHGMLESPIANRNMLKC